MAGYSSRFADAQIEENDLNNITLKSNSNQEQMKF